MGNSCFGASQESRAYGRGEDPTALSVSYQIALKQQKQDVPALKTAQMLERHSSKSSLHSGTSSAILNMMSPDEKDAYLIKQMKKEAEALKLRKAFLESVRDALIAINEEVESLDSRDENDRFQDEFQRKIGTKQRANSVMKDSFVAEMKGLRKVNNFRLKQHNRMSLKRVKKPATENPVEQKRLSVHKPIVGARLLGEGTREWNNAFGGRLSLVRRFYDWDDIPLEFFVDKQVESGRVPSNRRNGQQQSRSLLAARMGEKLALQHLMADDKLFQLQKAQGNPSPTEKKLPKQPSHPPPNTQRISVGNDVIEIDLSSIDSSDDEEYDDGDLQPRITKKSEISTDSSVPI